jgi:hypothetical protein
MDKYYYLLAQLPILDFKSKEYIDTKYFVEQAEKWLSFKDFDIFKRARIDNIYLERDDSGIVREYKFFEYSLRDSIVKFREGNIEAILDKNLKDILGSGDPLKVELGLLRLRWDFIDSLEISRNFDLERVILYFYRLQILDRISQFDREKAERLFDKISSIDYEVMIHEN